MKKYVKVVEPSGWEKHNEVILAVSVGQDYHERDRFEATVHWANKNFDRIHVLVGDVLQRHNILSDDAEQQARDAGTAWMDRNIPTVAATGKLASVLRWDDMTSKPEFKGILAEFKKAVRENKVFRTAVQNDISRFVARQKDSLPRGARKRSFNYILEELAAISLYARTQPGARPYPSKNLETFALVEAGEIPEAPRGLEKETRLNIAIRNRDRKKKSQATVAPISLHA